MSHQKPWKIVINLYIALVTLCHLCRWLKICFLETLIRVRLVRLGTALAVYCPSSLVLWDGSDLAGTKIEVTWSRAQDAKFKKNFAFTEQYHKGIHQLFFPWICLSIFFHLANIKPFFKIPLWFLLLLQDRLLERSEGSRWRRQCKHSLIDQLIH